jgi:hypothetical protein
MAPPLVSGSRYHAAPVVSRSRNEIGAELLARPGDFVFLDRPLDCRFFIGPISDPDECSGRSAQTENLPTVIGFGGRGWRAGGLGTVTRHARNIGQPSRCFQPRLFAHQGQWSTASFQAGNLLFGFVPAADFISLSGAVQIADRNTPSVSCRVTVPGDHFDFKDLLFHSR